MIESYQGLPRISTLVYLSFMKHIFKLRTLESKYVAICDYCRLI